MGRDHGKQKMVVAGEEVELDHNGDEEERIQEFFTIIKRLREARASIRNRSCELEASSKDVKKVKVHGPVWIPVFKVEDFAGQERYGSSNISVRRSCEDETSKEKEKKREEKGLDLNLSL